MDILKLYLKLYLKLAKSLEKSKGFTLLELLVAIAMSGIVLVGLGSGMVALMNSSNNNSAKAELKNQLNRAADYINEDIKRARFADITTTSTTNDTVVLTYFENATDTESNTIEYRMETASNPWLGPNVISRRVTIGSSAPGNWQVLVDAITDNDVTFPNCGSPTKTEYTSGFFACVESAKSNRSVDVYRVSISLFGEVSDNDEIEVNTSTIARSISPSLSPPTINLVSDQDPTPEIQWSNVLLASSYAIYRCSTTGGAGNCDPTDGTSDTIVYSGPGTTFIESINTSTGERWCYSGVSSDGGNTSDFGNIVCAAVSTGGAPGSSNLDATDALQPIVTWTQAIDADSYSLYRCSTSNATCDPINSGSLIFGPTTNLTYNQSTAMPAVSPPVGQKLCYQVRSTNSYGTIDTNIDCGLPNSSSTPNTPSLSINASNSNIVTWSDESASGATTYALYQCQADAGNTCVPSTLAPGFPQFTNTFTQTTAAATNKRWCYGVEATNTSPASPLTSPRSTAVCGAVALSKPFFTSALTGSTTPNVAWNNVASATSYDLYRCSTLSATCDPSTGTKIVTNTTVTSFPETTAPLNNQKHCYAVQAKNASGVSPFSDTSCSDIKSANCTMPNVLLRPAATSAEQNAVTTLIQNAGFTSTPTYVEQTGGGVTPKGFVISTNPAQGSSGTCNRAITVNYRKP